MRSRRCWPIEEPADEHRMVYEVFLCHHLRELFAECGVDY